MDLRSITINNSKLQGHGYGEIAKECSTPKHFKDKRKTDIASKALLNSVINKNTISQEKDCIYIPNLIEIAFPSNLNNFAKESIEVANGLLDFVHGISKVVWDNIEEDELEDEDSDDDEGDSD
ncbi:hypothetical protein PS6_005384 [Mucor atramentarius]